MLQRRSTPAAEPEKKAKAPKKEKAPEPAEKTYSKEDVRALLAAKANEAGGQFKAQVKAIVKKYADSGSLTDVPADSYPALVKEMEGLKDASSARSRRPAVKEQSTTWSLQLMTLNSPQPWMIRR